MTSRVCLVPRLSGLGGMVSFQHKLAAGLHERGIEVSYSLNDHPYQAVLVIGGFRDVLTLYQVKRSGIRIVQRLNGMNWLHRVRRTGLRHFLRSEYGNLILASIRSRIASSIVYQSEFSRSWWERVHGKTPVPHSVVYNGVDLARFTPDGPSTRPADRYRLLLVEGTLGGGYEIGLETAVDLARRLSQMNLPRPLELQIAGRVNKEFAESWQSKSPVPLTFLGQLPHESVPELDRSAQLLFSADINAACPNSVVEALACGLPVVAFDTGALPEMVCVDAGRVVPYGGNPWKLDPPDVQALAHASYDILVDQDRFRQGARARAEEVFSLDTMVDGYVQALLG